MSVAAGIVVSRRPQYADAEVEAAAAPISLLRVFDTKKFPVHTVSASSDETVISVSCNFYTFNKSVNGASEHAHFLTL